MGGAARPVDPDGRGRAFDRARTHRERAHQALRGRPDGRGGSRSGPGDVVHDDDEPGPGSDPRRRERHPRPRARRPAGLGRARRVRRAFLRNRPREYRYAIATGDVADPFTARYAWHRPGRLHVPSMRRAGVLLLGERDFASFCRNPGTRTIDGPRSSTRRRATRGDQLTIAFRANAFLHQMVRSLVGTLVTVGTGRLEPDGSIGSSGRRIVRRRHRSRRRTVSPWSASSTAGPFRGTTGG
jgi:Pseudouridylate synthase